MAKQNNSDFIDIPALLRQYASKWYWFVISVIACIALALLVIQVRQPKYAVRANLLISQEKSPIEAKLGEMSSLLGGDSFVDDEVFQVKSHTVYAQVARKLGINATYYVHEGFLKNVLTYPKIPLTVTAQAGMPDTLATGIRFTVDVDKSGKADIKAKIKRSTVAKAKKVSLPYTLDTPLGQFTFATTEFYAPGEDLEMKIDYCGYDGAAEDLDLEVNVEIASKRSNVITLGINTTNPTYGKAVLDCILEEYNQRGIREKNNQGILTEKFLEDRIALMANDLNDAEMQVQDFKENKSIYDLGTEVKYQTEKKGLVEEKLIEAQTQAEIIAMTRDFISNPENAFSMVPLVVENEGLMNLIGQYNSLVLARQELVKSANPDNINLKQMEERIDKMRDNISMSVTRAAQTQEVAVRDLTKELESTEGSLSTMPAIEREFITLRRQQNVKSQLYYFLLQRREENSMLLANTIPKGQIIDQAYTLSEPLGIGKKGIALIALFMGLMIPPVLLYIRRLLNNRFETRSDVERITDVPILGEMCVDNTGRKIVVGTDATDSPAELFRLMRSNLLFILNNVNDKVVLLTSSGGGEGKSFISINLAASLSLIDKRVLLVGMDIRNPRLAQYLDMNPRYGLTQYLASPDVKLNQIITPVPGIPGLDVICAGPVPPNPAELLISNHVDELFQRLREMYDYIIVDTAPIGLVSDTFTLDRIADAAIYVCRANYTSLNDLNLVNQIYEQHRLKKLSIVVNGTATKKTYGYGQKKAHKG